MSEPQSQRQSQSPGGGPPHVKKNHSGTSFGSGGTGSNSKGFPSNRVSEGVKNLLRQKSKLFPREQRKPAHFAAVSKDREVRVRVIVKRLLQIDLKKQQFTADVKLECSWLSRDTFEAVQAMMEYKEPRPPNNEKPPNKKDFREALSRVCWDEDKTDQTRGRLEIFMRPPNSQRLRKKPTKADITLTNTLFAPAVYFRNLLEDQLYEEAFNFYLEGQDDNAEMWKEHEKPKLVVCYRKSFRGTFESDLDLHHFPFDEQNLEMILATAWAREEVLATSWEREEGDEIVRLVCNEKDKYESHVVVQNFLQKASYTLSPHLRFESDSTEPLASTTQATYSLLKISMHVERKYLYWIVSVVCPLFFLTCVLCTSFEVPEEEFADRSSITVTALLAMVAFQTTIAERLPDELSYMTYLDKYIFTCFTFAFAVILWQSASAMRGSPFEHPLNVDLDPLLEPYVLDSGYGYVYPLPLFYIGTLSGWVAFHFLLILWLVRGVLLRYTYRHRFWHSSRRDRSLWFGPISLEPELTEKNGAGPYFAGGEYIKRRHEIEASIKKRLNELKPMRRACRKAASEVSRVRIWHADEAAARLRAEEVMHVLDPPMKWYHFGEWMRYLTWCFFVDPDPSRSVSKVPTNHFIVVTMKKRSGAEDLLSYARDEPVALRKCVKLALQDDKWVKLVYEEEEDDEKKEDVKRVENSERHSVVGGEGLRQRVKAPTTMGRLKPSWYPLVRSRPWLMKKIEAKLFGGRNVALQPLMHLTELRPIKLDHIKAERAAKPIDGTNVSETVVSISLEAEVTIKDHLREGFLIPSKAKRFAFFYPHGNQEGGKGSEICQMKCEEVKDDDLEDGGFVLKCEGMKDGDLKEGGFVYFDEKGDVCALRKIAPGACFSFRRQEMDATEHAALVELKKLFIRRAVTFDTLSSIGVKHFYWIPPYRALQTEIYKGAPPPEGIPKAKWDYWMTEAFAPGCALHCEHGGFAYTYSNEKEFVPEFDCVFKLKQPRGRRDNRRTETFNPCPQAPEEVVVGRGELKPSIPVPKQRKKGSSASSDSDDSD